MKKDVILSVKNLDITFRANAGKIHAIRGVDFDLPTGKTIALVGDRIINLLSLVKKDLLRDFSKLEDM